MQKNFFWINAKKLQPSQLYISSYKKQKNQEWLKGLDTDYDAIPIIEMGGNLVMTDGHTRAVILCELGAEEVKVYWDEDEMDLEAYGQCVAWCEEEGIKSPFDLMPRVISKEAFEEKWIGRCQKMHKMLEASKRSQESLALIPYTRERCHAFYKSYIPDPMMTEEAYVYEEDRVNRYFDQKVNDPFRRFFAIEHGGRVIGEIQLKKLDLNEGHGTLSIILANDSVKNKGFGTKAELLMIAYAKSELKLKKIFADTIHRNTRSRRVLEKIGFEFIESDEHLAYFKKDL